MMIHWPLDTQQSTVEADFRGDRINAWRMAIERCMKWTKIKYLEEKRVDYRRMSTIPVGFYLMSSFGILMLSHYYAARDLSNLVVSN